MKRTKTFIVGAGASAEFGLPTGSELVKKIEQVCRVEVDSFDELRSGDKEFCHAFGYLPRTREQRWNRQFFASIAKNIRQNMGLAPSIDNFLDTHQAKDGWVEVGKLAIARTVLEAEAHSKLWFDIRNTYNQPSFAQLPNNWLSELFRILVTQKGESEFCAALSSCRFITFNYDRVIEQFFHQAIKSYFDVSNETANTICANSLNVVHVYGSLGKVNCSFPNSFGNWKDPRYLAEAAMGLRTFTEGASEPSEIERARNWLGSSDLVCFLGFGFLPLNLRALAAREHGRYLHSVRLGTVKGIPTSNLEIALNVLRNQWYDKRDYAMPFEDVSANELIWRNSLLLSEEDL